MTNTPAAIAHEVSLTERAARSIADLMTADSRPDLRLRLAAHQSGCGLAYDLYLDDEGRPDDLVRQLHGIQLVVDPVSAQVLAGAVIDFVATPTQQGFTIDNPLALGAGGGCCT